MDGAIFFTACALLILVGALGTVSAHSPVRSAVGLLTTILGIAGLFLMLHAQFLAALQLIVYAGAVVVLFVFVIMMLGPSSQEQQSAGRGKLLRLSAGGLCALLGLGAVMSLASLSPELTRFPPPRETHGSVEALGGLIFSKGLVPFELATALLIVAAIGAVAVARGGAQQKLRARALPSGRFFAGPPREAHPQRTRRPRAKESR